MASEMMDALMALCEEKHIDQLYLIERLEQSLAKSYAEVLHLTDGARVTIDRMTGNVYVYKLIPREDSFDEETGEYTEFDEQDVTPKDTSRIAAQHAKTEIKAIVNNAAREQIYEEFSHRIGDIITGTVLQSAPEFTIVKIREGVEAELPYYNLQRHPEERNERPNGDVPVGYVAPTAGTYTIEAVRMDKPMLLKDLELGITFDLANGAYEFESAAGTFASRFMLVANDTATGIADIRTKTGVSIMPTAGGLCVDGLGGSAMSIYSLDGKLVGEPTSDGIVSLQRGTYVVSVGSTTAKVMVK